MSTTSPTSARSLRTLYFVRTLFQLAWAGTLLAVAEKVPTLAGALMVAYPVWDVACTLYDQASSSPDQSTRRVQTVNALIGLATALGIALTVFRHTAHAIAIFGTWALLAGLLQLSAGLIRRRALGGQWAMILSGAQSTAAGFFFIAGALSGKLHPRDLGGYALFGAAYFLVGGLLLARASTRTVAQTGTA